MKAPLEKSLKEGSLRRPFHGVLLINKIDSNTSHDIVQKIRHIFQQKAVGHAGTLDPLAQGLLVILLGQATKLSHYLLNNDKRYWLKMKFGLETDTFDREGKVLKSKPVHLRQETIEEALRESLGELQLTVPYFSAVKVKGRKLYSYARVGEKVDLPVKIMSFYDLKILNIGKDTASVSISCTKGSYMRSWVHFVGEKLKTGACLMELTREKSFPFHLSDSVTVKELEESFREGPPESKEVLKQHFPKSFLLTAESLPQYPAVELTKKDRETLFTGQIPGFLIEESMSWQIEVNKTHKSQIFQAVKDKQLLALLELQPFKKVKILKNFIPA